MNKFQGFGLSLKSYPKFENLWFSSKNNNINFPGELFERTYQRVHIFRLKLNSSLLLPFIRIEYVMTITVCSMATKPQDWHPIRVHCCVKQYKISPQVLFKTKTLMVVFRKNQSGECTQTIANAWIKSHFAKKIR